MTVIKCAKGHHYEKTANPDGCPHCADLSQDDNGAAALTEKTVAAYAVGKGDKGRRSGPMSSKDDERTQAHWKFDMGEPICGWLVCYEGADRGRDYRIVPGRNSIGRDTSSAICIRGDESISRLNHAYIYFEMETCVFYLALDLGKVGIYRNGKIVLSPTELAIYDDIRIGKSKFKFVPLCGEKFRWETDEKKTKKTKAGRDDDDDEGDREDEDDDAGDDVDRPSHSRPRGGTIG